MQIVACASKQQASLVVAVLIVVSALRDCLVAELGCNCRYMCAKIDFSSRNLWFLFYSFYSLDQALCCSRAGVTLCICNQLAQLAYSVWTGFLPQAQHVDLNLHALHPRWHAFTLVQESFATWTSLSHIQLAQAVKPYSRDPHCSNCASAPAVKTCF